MAAVFRVALSANTACAFMCNLFACDFAACVAACALQSEQLCELV